MTATTCIDAACSMAMIALQVPHAVCETGCLPACTSNHPGLPSCLSQISCMAELTVLSRELWYRASLAWQDILSPDTPSSALLVAHNAVNQVGTSGKAAGRLIQRPQLHAVQAVPAVAHLCQWAAAAAFCCWTWEACLHSILVQHSSSHSPALTWLPPLPACQILCCVPEQRCHGWCSHWWPGAVPPLLDKTAAERCNQRCPHTS